MARAPRPIDISNLPELLRLVEEMRKSDEPRLLRKESEDLAILTPVKPAPKPKRRRVKTEADYEAFRSAAGSWKDVDTDKLVAEIYESRRRSSRPPVARSLFSIFRPLQLCGSSLYSCSCDNLLPAL